jgi:SAM-dependent methyltransferase
VNYRFYGELASWWPLISPADEYVEEAAYALGLLRSAAIPVHEVLELGSGGGHNAVHMKRELALTLVDLSDDMLDVSRRINPECEHVQGDMRSVRLGRTFDAVFVHDAVDYMVSESDLRQAIDTAYLHGRPGGIAVFIPDQTRETFVDETDVEAHDADDGRAVRYLVWSWDPDPTDTTTRTEYSFLLRDADGSVRAVHESHQLGLFDRATWLRLLTDAGFTAERVVEQTTEDRPPRDVFLARRPS